MSKRQINFSGPSIHELGIKMEDEKSKNDTSIFTNTKKGSPKNGIGEISNTNNGNTENEISAIGISKKHNTLQFRTIRNYIDTALGNSERIEVKLSDVCAELGINLKTFYKHLKYLRETEFVLTKLQYGTEIKRRR